MDWKKFAWLNRGKRRRIVLELLAKTNSPLTTNDIRKILEIQISQASAVLSELLEQKLVVCKNPDDKIGRLFEISDEGKSIVKQLGKRNNDLK